jgi:hypothetical protein
MPNFVTMEVLFRNVDAETQQRILAAACNTEGEIDFEVLLPIPLNCWKGAYSVFSAPPFPCTWHDWCSENWGTKWNACNESSEPVVRTDDSLTLQFDTAWAPPYGWLVALYNKLRLPFEYNWLFEGKDCGYSGSFDPSEVFDPDCPRKGFNEWKEAECDGETRKRLCLRMYGVESLAELAEEHDEADVSVETVAPAEESKLEQLPTPTTVKIGTVAVDTGQIVILDPCRADNLDAVTSLSDANQLGDCSTGLDDGRYPVFADVVDVPQWGSRIAGVHIHFDPIYCFADDPKFAAEIAHNEAEYLAACNCTEPVDAEAASVATWAPAPPPQLAQT